MGKINLGGVILGGIVAGVVSDVLGYLVDGMMLAPQWTEQMKALGQGALTPSQLIWLNVLGLVGGVATIWIYAAIRPRFGAGAMTAVYAGVAVWVVGVLIPNVSFMWVSGFFGRRLTTMTTAGGLVEVVVGAVVGAALYKEPVS